MTINSFKDLSITEQRIIAKIINAAFAKGWAISVYDGEEWTVKSSDNFFVVTCAIGSTDCTTLKFRNPAVIDNNGRATVVGSIFLVHGNDEDVVSDMTDNEAMTAITNI